MFNNFNWTRIIQLALIIFAIVLIPTVIIPAAADLITSGIQSAGSIISDMLKPISHGGDGQLNGLVRLCLYLVFFTMLMNGFLKK